jgi:hypothetical protein
MIYLEAIPDRPRSVVEFTDEGGSWFREGVRVVCEIKISILIACYVREAENSREKIYGFSFPLAINLEIEKKTHPCAIL